MERLKGIYSKVFKNDHYIIKRSQSMPEQLPEWKHPEENGPPVIPPPLDIKPGKARLRRKLGQITPENTSDAMTTHPATRRHNVQQQTHPQHRLSSGQRSVSNASHYYRRQHAADGTHSNPPHDLQEGEVEGGSQYRAKYQPKWPSPKYEHATSTSSYVRPSRGQQDTPTSAGNHLPSAAIYQDTTTNQSRLGPNENHLFSAPVYRPNMNDARHARYADVVHTEDDTYARYHVPETDWEFECSGDAAPKPHQTRSSLASRGPRYTLHETIVQPGRAEKRRQVVVANNNFKASTVEYIGFAEEFVPGTNNQVIKTSQHVGSTTSNRQHPSPSYPHHPTVETHPLTRYLQERRPPNSMKQYTPTITGVARGPHGPRYRADVRNRPLRDHGIMVNNGANAAHWPSAGPRFNAFRTVPFRQDR